MTGRVAGWVHHTLRAKVLELEVVVVVRARTVPPVRGWLQDQVGVVRVGTRT